ncbi:UNVERIFIED_CONTAM: hypothetical protein FKN15_073405 [Acipenser sinensis]
MNTRYPPKRVPSASRFFTHCRLTMQPPQSYSFRGQRRSGQLTGKPTGAWPDHGLLVRALVHTLPLVLQRPQCLGAPESDALGAHRPSVLQDPLGLRALVHAVPSVLCDLCASVLHFLDTPLCFGTFWSLGALTPLCLRALLHSVILVLLHPPYLSAPVFRSPRCFGTSVPQSLSASTPRHSTD